MNEIRKTSLLAVLSLFLCYWAYSQERHPDQEQVEHQEDHENQEEQPHHRHSVSVEIGHSHLSEGYRNGKNTWLTEPSWAINYNYHFDHRWSIGLHNEIIIEEFEVHHGEGEVIERCTR